MSNTHQALDNLVVAYEMFYDKEERSSINYAFLWKFIRMRPNTEIIYGTRFLVPLHIVCQKYNSDSQATKQKVFSVWKHITMVPSASLIPSGHSFLLPVWGYALSLLLVRLSYGKCRLLYLILIDMGHNLSFLNQIENILNTKIAELVDLHVYNALQCT